ncbi:hypothetical protein [Cognataquiflexum rubidum]|uniref:hypothetical protein n=1 Tax=Cognataquiflexum rubidum TaxID=2922273 RepID=UPI001F146A6F|nr:hypothetical protein [Cognataquiflexum rubidum]MCH6236483.1 hypothetical protein [Cognataquiflexum rubidum]
MEWINQTSFPKVFKLRNGASSWNVKLIKDKNEAQKIINIAFGIGFSHEPSPLDNFKEIWRKYKKGKVKFDSVKGAIKKFVFPKRNRNESHREIGYVYFQEFIPNNLYDIRIVIINNKGYGFRRKVRENDFRASGSGEFDFKRTSFPIDCIKIGFEIASKYRLQSAAFDFVIDASGKPLIVEVSYAFASSGNYKNCEGFWDNELNWYPGPFNPYGWMVETLLNS